MVEPLGAGAGHWADKPTHLHGPNRTRAVRPEKHHDPWDFGHHAASEWGDGRPHVLSDDEIDEWLREKDHLRRNQLQQQRFIMDYGDHLPHRAAAADHSLTHPQKPSCRTCWSESQQGGGQSYEDLLKQHHHDELTDIFSHDHYLEQQRHPQRPHQHGPGRYKNKAAHRIISHREQAEMIRVAERLPQTHYGDEETDPAALLVSPRSLLRSRAQYIMGNWEFITWAKKRHGCLWAVLGCREAIMEIMSEHDLLLAARQWQPEARWRQYFHDPCPVCGGTPVISSFRSIAGAKKTRSCRLPARRPVLRLPAHLPGAGGGRRQAS